MPDADTPNESSQPTAVGAGRSAGAVYVACRRWLGLFRYEPVPMKTRMLLLTAIIAAVLGIAAWQVLLRVVRASYGYHVRAQFASLPQVDTKLQEWIKAQPGVVAPHQVFIWRTNQTVTVFFIMSRNLKGYPPFPNLESACKELGYAGELTPFSDCPEKEWYASSR